MDLHVFRHGPAATADEAGVRTDRERPLTEDGTDATHAAARGVAETVDRLDTIVASPFRRAQQTARILADAFRIPHDEIETLDALQPDRDPMKTLEALWNRYDGSVAIVGHRPNLPRLVVGALTGEPDGAEIHLGTASLATVRIADDGTDLRRLIPRETLQMVTGSR